MSDSAESLHQQYEPEEPIHKAVNITRRALIDRCEVEEHDEYDLYRGVDPETGVVNEMWRDSRQKAIESVAHDVRMDTCYVNECLNYLGEDSGFGYCEEHRPDEYIECADEDCTYPTAHTETDHCSTHTWFNGRTANDEQLVTDGGEEVGQAINRQGRSCDLEYCQECGLSMNPANHGFFITERDVNGEGENARLFREDVEGYGNEWTGFEEEDIGAVCHSCSWILQRKRERVVLTDGGQPAEDGRAIDRPDPTGDPRVCSVCGVYIGWFGDEYCDGCAREIGAKPPLERCMGCGQRAPQEQMEPVDISPSDEYYPTTRYLCRGCSGGEPTDGG